MWILPLLGYIGVILGFAFLTLAIGNYNPHSSLPHACIHHRAWDCVNADGLWYVASGLYYLSELVEEHTVLAKKLLTRLIYTIIGLQLLLIVVDRFPVGLSLLSVGSHVIYAQNLRRFPIVKLKDPLFLVSCGEL